MINNLRVEMLISLCWFGWKGKEIEEENQPQ
jgi:hypothetical protein